MRFRTLCFAAAMLCAFGLAGGARAAGPKALITALYSEPNLTFGAAKSAGYFAHDLDVSLKGGRGDSNEVGSFDFDYRYGAQALDISGLQLLEEIDNDQAKVVAVFKNFGRPESVDWVLCRRADGTWRIADASSNTDKYPWDLRDMLKLDADRVRC